MTDHPYVDDQGRPSDSVGQAWAGKAIPSHGFAGDTGEADRRLVAALESCRVAPTPAAEVELMACVAAARWLVPVVAVPTEVDEHGGQVTDTRSEMAAVTLTSPDGQRALPMFSSVESLAAWDPAARPVPVAAGAAAQAAVSESCHVLVVDVASPHATVLRSSMLWALAQARPWAPAHLDPHVAAAVEAAVRDEAAVAGHRLEAGEPAGTGNLRVVLQLRPGLDRAELAALGTRIGERLAMDGETRARIDGLTFALETVT